MAKLINCKICKKEISNTVKKCPHCGYKNKNGVLFYLLLFIFLLFVISLFKPKEQEENKSKKLHIYKIDKNGNKISTLTNLELLECYYIMLNPDNFYLNTEQKSKIYHQRKIIKVLDLRDLENKYDYEAFNLKVCTQIPSEDAYIMNKSYTDLLQVITKVRKEQNINLIKKFVDEYPNVK
jgi:hypothetical protein